MVNRPSLIEQTARRQVSNSTQNFNESFNQSTENLDSPANTTGVAVAAAKIRDFDSRVSTPELKNRSPNPISNDTDVSCSLI